MAKAATPPAQDPLPAEGGSYLLNPQTGKWELLDRTEPALSTPIPDTSALSTPIPDTSALTDPNDTPPAADPFDPEPTD